MFACVTMCDKKEFCSIKTPLDELKNDLIIKGVIKSLC